MRGEVKSPIGPGPLPLPHCPLSSPPCALSWSILPPEPRSVKGIEIDRLAAEGVLGAPMRSPPRA